jgi:hypothetical protein
MLKAARLELFKRTNRKIHLPVDQIKKMVDAGDKRAGKGVGICQARCGNFAPVCRNSTNFGGFWTDPPEAVVRKRRFGGGGGGGAGVGQ